MAKTPAKRKATKPKRVVKKPRGKSTVKNSSTSPRALAQAEKQGNAIALRKQGLTYKQIGEQMKISGKSAYELVQAGMAAWQYEDVETVRKMELDRLDFMWNSLYEGVKAGQARSVEVALQLMDRRARIVPELFAVDERGKDKGVPDTMIQIVINQDEARY